MEFEWDDANSAANRRKHGLGLSSATSTCADPDAVEVVDDRDYDGETRMILIGRSGSLILTVVFTERGDRIRLISARKATTDEQRRYFEQFEREV